MRPEELHLQAQELPDRGQPGGRLPIRRPAHLRPRRRGDGDRRGRLEELARPVPAARQEGSDAVGDPEIRARPGQVALPVPGKETEGDMTWPTFRTIARHAAGSTAGHPASAGRGRFPTPTPRGMAMAGTP